jgi:hypothetical protein
MSEGNSWLRAAVALPLVLLVACTEAVAPGAPLDADAPAIEQDVVRLRSGERQALSLERGAGTVAWLVLDEDVATVDQAGVLRAGSPGMTWALAVTAAARDSVRVVVSFDDIVDGGVAFSLGHSSASTRLNGIGVIKFEQIANFSDEDIATVDEVLTLNGRIEKDDWTGQAQRLMAEATAGEVPAEGDASAAEGEKKDGKKK